MMMGKSPEQSAARKSVRRFFEARDAFMAECRAVQTLDSCTISATWKIESGFAKGAATQPSVSQ